MLALIHKLKSGKHIIPLDADAALQNTSFAVYRQERHGLTDHIGLGIVLKSTQTGGEKKAKYEGHEFELLISPEHIDKFIAAAQWAKQRFIDEGWVDEEGTGTEGVSG